ncbi:hypothetical protein HanXRQr2_Chr13g0573591 [Helianthus annuus]|uniref:Uncharacterized protein n=1 Tax=Helianthus annuus TaxID=4232 RepID=A0A9K3EFN4_HELAN|nr:hypothetical protein HanXRQr2_Chr13g0573591 [Helianthus annuus]
MCVVAQHLDIGLLDFVTRSLELRIWHGLAGFPAAFRFRVIRGSRLMALSWTSHGP